METAFDSSNGLLYITFSQSPAIVEVNLASNKVQGIVSIIGEGPASTPPLYDPSNGYVYVGGSSSVTIINGSSVFTAVNLTSSLQTGNVMSLDSSSGHVFVEDSSGQISILDGSKVIGNYHLGFQASSIAISSSKGYLYATSALSNNVTVIDSKSGSFVSNISVGQTLQGQRKMAAVSDTGNGLVYVSDSNEVFNSGILGIRYSP